MATAQELTSEQQRKLELLANTGLRRLVVWEAAAQQNEELTGVDEAATQLGLENEPLERQVQGFIDETCEFRIKDNYQSEYDWEIFEQMAGRIADRFIIPEVRKEQMETTTTSTTQQKPQLQQGNQENQMNQSPADQGPPQHTDPPSQKELNNQQGAEEVVQNQGDITVDSRNSENSANQISDHSSDSDNEETGEEYHSQ
jgi:hypothetical protein